MKSVYSGEYKRIIEKLKQARKAAGLTQEEVAAKLEKPQSFVSKIESGERRIDVVELSKLAALYGLSINSVITR